MLARLLICGARIPGSRGGERRELEEGDPLCPHTLNDCERTAEGGQPLDLVTGQEAGSLLPVMVELRLVARTQTRKTV